MTRLSYSVCVCALLEIVFAVSSATVATARPPHLDCDVDVAILIDSSSAVGSNEAFQEEVEFVRTQLLPTWQVDSEHTEVALQFYASLSMAVPPYFTYADNAAVDQMLQQGRDHYWLDMSPSITKGLKELISTALLRERRKTSLVTLIITFTSDYGDVLLAQKYADQLMSGNDSVIVLGIGANVDWQVLQSIGQTALTSLTFSPFLAAAVNYAICYPPLKSTHLAITPTPQPAVECAKNVILLIDSSNGMSADEFSQMRSAIVSKLILWDIAPTAVEVAAFTYCGHSFTQLCNFDLLNRDELAMVIDQVAIYHPNSAPNIARAVLAAVEVAASSSRPVSTILITASSDATDVQKAVKYSELLAMNGISVTTLALGRADPALISQIASGAEFAFSSTDFDFSAAVGKLVRESSCQQLPSKAPLA